MVYKLGNLKDLESLPPMDKITYGVLWEFTSVLTNEYGENRDIDNDDGGFVLYARSCKIDCVNSKGMIE